MRGKDYAVSETASIKRLRSIEEAQLAFPCMAEVPSPWPESLAACRNWVSQNLGRYVEGYHVELANGEIVGQLYYAPSEQALIPYRVEPGVAVIYCEWVQRRHQRRGFGRQLFSTFEAQMRESGCKGILIEATEHEQYMHYRHYLARGFEPVLENEDRKVLYLSLQQAQVQVTALAPRIRPHRGVPVEILVLSGYLCPFETSTHLLLLDVAREFGDRVRLRQESLTPNTLERYGVAGGIFINGRRKLAGATSEAEIQQAILEEF